MSDNVTQDELNECKQGMGLELAEVREAIEKTDDSVNLILSELQKLNKRIENLGNSVLSGEVDDGK